MIEHINASGHIIISGASSSGPYISNYNNQLMVGMVRRDKKENVRGKKEIMGTKTK
jgi:hypothetical protein